MKLESLKSSKFEALSKSELNKITGGYAVQQEVGVQTATICTSRTDKSDTGHADAPTND
ncbi:MAG: bacteriocin [Taibaiella sp.]